MKRSEIREALRRGFIELVLWSRDLRDLVSGRRDPLIPPRRLMFDGPRDPAVFRASGEEYLRLYRELCGLARDERILDMGSGIGRKTLPLTRYLDERATYVGCDIHRRGITWCRRRISSRWPNFRFHLLDVHNDRYNPRGTLPAHQLVFPFPDRSFDLVVMASVFTHMFPRGIERYLRETRRVLDPDRGRSLISFFLLDEASRAGIRSGSSAFEFQHHRESHWVENPLRPEDAVALETSLVRELYARSGLEIEAIHRGQWSGDPTALSFQDLILARPRRDATA